MTAQTTSRSAVVTLPAEHQVLITRTFDAPRHHVYMAWTTPELVRRWWHAKRGEITEIKIDLRVGGRWRYAMLAHGRFEVAFHGEYQEIVPDERLVSTEVFEGAPEAQALTTNTFTEEGGRTTVTILVEHASQADRDAHIASGMEDGLQDALDLLELAALELASGPGS
jgi:uncharacterized protein YndB with AHSA1/START domain